MKSLTAPAALVFVLVLGCGPTAPPGPGPAPTPAPIPSPSPTPVPVSSGFDCDHPPAVSGLVSVKEPIADRYIVVMKPEAPAGGAAGGIGRGSGRGRVESSGGAGLFKKKKIEHGTLLIDMVDRE